MQITVSRLDGAYALAVIDAEHPEQIVAARQGSPLVIGVGIGENFLASDQMALRQVDRSIYLSGKRAIWHSCPPLLSLFMTKQVREVQRQENPY